MMFPSITLVLGGVRSGKSALAEKLVACSNRAAVYLASAQPHDDEMSARIARHQIARQRDARDTNWQTIEEPLAIAAVLGDRAATDCVLFDCATLWLSNHMMAGSDLAIESDHLTRALRTCAAPVVIVSNEVGLGGIAGNAMARQFGDAQGTLNQALAAQADLVISVIAGLPMVLKGTLPKGIA